MIKKYEKLSNKFQKTVKLSNMEHQKGFRQNKMEKKYTAMLNLTLS